MDDAAPKEWCLIIKFSTSPWVMSIDGDVENGDMALAMLDQARRKIETDLRVAAGIQAQLEFKKNQEEHQRVRNILEIGSRKQ